MDEKKYIAEKIDQFVSEISQKIGLDPNWGMVIVFVLWYFIVFFHETKIWDKLPLVRKIAHISVVITIVVCILVSFFAWVKAN